MLHTTQVHGRHRLGLLLVTLAVLLVPFGASAQGSGSAVKVGLLASLTGRMAASFGLPFKNGFELALTDIASSGALSAAKLSIDLQTLDASSDVTKSVTAYNRFAQQKVPIVISDSHSPIGQAIAPLANDAQIAFLSGSGSVLENKAGFAFRFTDLVTPTGAVGKYLVGKGAKRIGAVIANDNPSFPTLAATTVAGLPTGYVSTQTITTKDNNFSAVITNLKNANIDALVFAILPEQAGNMIQQMADSGSFQKVILAGTLATSGQTHTIAGKSAVGLVFPQAWAPGAPRSRAFEAAYKAKYNEMPTAYGGLGYQVAWIVAAAMVDAAKSGKGITGDTLRAAIPAASTGELIKKHGILDLALLANGEAKSPGSLSTFAENGNIVSLGN